MPNGPILVVNSGSSSLKFGLCTAAEGEEQLLLDGAADGIGSGSGKLELRDGHGRTLRSEALRFASQGEALERVVQWIADVPHTAPHAIGHRVVHGGPRLLTHQRITPELLAELRRCRHFAPMHIPTALQLIEKAGRAYPETPQFACFDTAFHRGMPEAAARFALPAGLFDEGIRRYGFHGLSYESIVHQFGAGLADRTVIAHLGHGASLAALKGGASVDTSMGLTPTGGIPMASRSGDLDPGVLLYLLRVKRMSTDGLEELLNVDSGLKALSGGKEDMRDLETAVKAGSRPAELAVEIFCMSIRKEVAAYAAVLGGLDMLIFTGGIGEHSAQVRDGVCRGLGFLGAAVDASANRLHSGEISTKQSKIRICVAASREELQMVRHCRNMLRHTASEAYASDAGAGGAGRSRAAALNIDPDIFREPDS